MYFVIYFKQINNNTLISFHMFDFDIFSGAPAPPEIRLATPGAPPIRCLVIGSFYGQSVYRLYWSSRFKEVQRQRNNGRRGLGLLLYQVWEVKTPNKELVGNLYVWFNMFVWFSQINVFTPSGSARVGRGWFQSNVQSTFNKTQ